jgi:hypothetical protein
MLLLFCLCWHRKKQDDDDRYPEDSYAKFHGRTSEKIILLNRYLVKWNNLSNSSAMSAVRIALLANKNMVLKNVIALSCSSHSSKRFLRRCGMDIPPA